MNLFDISILIVLVLLLLWVPGGVLLEDWLVRRETKRYLQGRNGGNY